ncbi:sensor histidine kinase [Gracilimonas sp.]|uniref:sensor histidine kinase n=1 Tax=Gracilimonas sp. TaxID=1974203 RepID=UPI003D0D7B6D
MKKFNRFQSIHQLIPFSKLFKLLIGVSACVQLIVITYNHLSGYSVLDDTIHFIAKFTLGTFLSLIAAFLIAYPDLMIIQSLNKKLSWQKSTFTRAILQFVLSTILAVSVSTIITFLSHSLSEYQGGLLKNLLYNALIFSVCNLIMMIILEAWIFFEESNESKRKSEQLERELVQIRFEVLKNQINPHFMFNSLNVLSGLIETNTQKAQDFIDEFSQIYRYVLQTIEEPLVTLHKELSFARSYIFLQQIRYGENLNFSVDLPTHLLDYYLPPLSLQVALENACKHNQISPDKPLQLSITNEDDFLVIQNNIKLKKSGSKKGGIGQKNLAKRYSMVSSVKPTFRMKAKSYEVTLPLIKDI